jgi:hypothetical protein
VTVNVPIKAAEIARIAAELKAMCGDDSELFSDMLEGETDLHQIVERIHENLFRDGEILGGISVRQNSLSERKARIERRVETGKTAILKLMQAGQQTKLELSEATYSIRAGRPKLIIASDDAVPAKWQRTKREPDKAAINEAFADKAKLPNWLSRSDPQYTLSVRTK